jgi:hypothetical protein
MSWEPQRQSQLREHTQDILVLPSASDFSTHQAKDWLLATQGAKMTTRLNYMAALKSAWEKAPSEPEKVAALKKYQGAKQSNAARIEKAAKAHLLKSKAPQG